MTYCNKAGYHIGSVQGFYAFLIYCAIALVPFQNISLSAFGSKYDLSAFIILFATVLFLVFSNQKLASYVLITVFISSQLLIWIFWQIAPFHRLVSGLVWFGGLVAIILFSRKSEYSRRTAFQVLQFIMAVTALQIILQKFFYKVERPLAFFDEPSYAGLVLFGSAAVIAYKILYGYVSRKTFKFLDLINLLLVFSAAILTRSMHIFTFGIAVLIILFVLDLRPRFYFVFFILTFALSVVGLLFLDFDHISDRLIFSENTVNLSGLSWLRGLDQAKHAVSNSPLIGYGLGSTGYIKFESIYTEKLSIFGLPDLNLTDAYSGLFRLAVEIGAVAVAVIIYLMLLQIKALRCNRKIELADSERFYASLLAFFGLSMLIGILIKEPAYSRGYVYLSIFLMASNWSKLMTLKKNKLGKSTNV